jgi:hypothetical protein
LVVFVWVANLRQHIKFLNGKIANEGRRKSPETYREKVLARGFDGEEDIRFSGEDEVVLRRCVEIESRFTVEERAKKKNTSGNSPTLRPTLMML